MRVKTVSVSVQLASMLALSGILVGAFASQSWAQSPGSDPQPGLTETEQQNDEPVAPITGVQLQPTPAGLEILLQTPAGAATLVQTYTSEQQLIAEITNAQLALPEGDTFRQDNPTEQIESVTVTPLAGNRIRVVVTGTTSAPSGQVFLRQGQGLVVSVQTPAATESPSPQAEEDLEPIELVVTAEREEEGYYVPEASVGTRTETPIQDIPQSIQVVPQQVIEEQQATRLIDVLQNVPGVAQAGVSPRTFSNFFTIRGFNASDNILINGLQDPNAQSVSFGANVERVEVLKGPASVLFGQGSLGGVVNLVTKQPLPEPFYSIDASVGSFDFYRGAVDLSGPLNEEKTVQYRLNASAQTTESFIDFYEQQRYLVAPVLTWQISDRTKLTLGAEYARIDSPLDFGIPAEGSVLPNPNGEIPRNRFVGEPDIDNSQNRVYRVGFDFNHRFSDDWQMRSVFKTSLLRLDREIVFPTSLEDDGRTLGRGFGTQDYNDNNFNLDNYVSGEFSTGSIKHEIVTGFNLYRQNTDTSSPLRSIAPLDIFEPVYGASPTGPVDTRFVGIDSQIQQLGIYVQDLISFTDDLKVLLGGRFDIANQRISIPGQDVFNEFNQEEAFSPRIGIVYQPIEPISLYASYSRSFSYATSPFGPPEPEPERGTQYEVGVKAELNQQLSTTLAFYNLTRSNLPTPDSDNPGFSIQVGEQRSRGIEFDISGEILPGWNIIAGYAYTDARITEDNDFEVGNRLNNVPKHGVNLWTTYEIQTGDLKGLGFGIGAFFVGERPGDLANTFDLPGYTRTDAAIFYNRDSFRAALNFRNLLDTDYFISAQSRARVFPGEPLTVVGSLAWEF